MWTCLLGLLAVGQAPVELLRNADFAAGTDGWYLSGAGLKASGCPADVGGVRQALRLVAQPAAGASSWSLGLQQVTRVDLAAGDVVRFGAWLRSPDSLPATFVLEESAAPFGKELVQQVALGPQWQHFEFATRLKVARPAGTLHAKWYLGHGPGTVELAAVRLEKLTGEEAKAALAKRDWYGGRPHPDTWRAPALARIEQLRKGDLTITVVDVAGQPVPNARVAVKQQRHFFRFGSAVPAVRLADTADPDSLRMQREIARLYNTVTFENDLKWHDPNPKSDKVVDTALAWLKDHEIAPRGHNLIWGSFKYSPKSLKALDREALRAALARRVADQAGRYRGVPYLWDVVNEAVSEHDVWDKAGWDLFPASFKLAKQADPAALTCYNDFGILTDNRPHRTAAAARIRDLLAAGAPVDRLGMQAHMGVPLVPIPRVLELMDEWASFGPELEITEFDLGGCDDDAVHGEYVRDMLLAAFSHPKLRAFIMWGFWEGAHWRAKEHAQMFNRDWTPRPAQAAWEQLVLHDWWTDWHGTSRADGSARLRAFYGRQAVTVEDGGRTSTATVELVPGGPNAVRVVVR